MSIRPFLRWSVVPVLLVLASATGGADLKNPPPEYVRLNRRLLTGWNTWDAADVLSHIFLPDGFAVTLEIRAPGRRAAGLHLGQDDKPGLEVIPGGHAYDGSYTDLLLRGSGLDVRIETAARGRDLDILLTNNRPETAAVLDVVPAMKWGRKGALGRTGSALRAEVSGKDWTVRLLGAEVREAETGAGPRLTAALGPAAGVTTDPNTNLDRIAANIREARQKHERGRAAFGERGEIYDALQSVLAWNTIYEDRGDRIITPVSRSWCTGNGYVLFEWDTYLACLMLALDNKDLAYANLVAITSEATPAGFVPNFTTAKNKSSDRSQPPLGAMAVRAVHRRYGDRWILEALFPTLLAWNRWWPKARDWNGYLCWGSNLIPIGPETGSLDRKAIHKLQGAKYESGLDNSPMYDTAAFDPERSLMALADVGLMSLYIMDCRALADLAAVLGKKDLENELRDRAGRYARTLETLWDEKTGLYLNKDLRTGAASPRKSPTLFYPLLARVPSPEKAGRMIAEHLRNPQEFGGDLVLPSISRDDPEFSNTYWRGRIWGPMNFLVYLGLRNYDLPEARADLVRKSRDLMLGPWRKSRAVHENYSPLDGAGTSDDFYHWGALLGFMTFLEDGLFEL